MKKVWSYIENLGKFKTFIYSKPSCFVSDSQSFLTALLNTQIQIKYRNLMTCSIRGNWIACVHTFNPYASFFTTVTNIFHNFLFDFNVGSRKCVCVCVCVGPFRRRNGKRGWLWNLSVNSRSFCEEAITEKNSPFDQMTHVTLTEGTRRGHYDIVILLKRKNMQKYPECIFRCDFLTKTSPKLWVGGSQMS